MSREQIWPAALWLVRHGQSAGNVARDAAEAGGAPEILLSTRDMDVPLSQLGEEQAQALGRWIGEQPERERPNVVLASTYLRAQCTARIALESAGLGAVPIGVDERLREREFGVLDRLTRRGIEERYPDQARLRLSLGKFYHRPPGGESWCDVILRLRSVIDTLTRQHHGQRVMVVAHQVVVLCFRYLLEGLSEEQLLVIDQTQDLANCGLTEYRCDPEQGRHGTLALTRFNFTAPLEVAGAAVTRRDDVPIAAG